MATLLAAMGIAEGAAAQSLPAVKATAGNAVPACTTPGRLMAYLRARNPSLDPRFTEIAVEYMRHGEQLGIRWDYAFYQMILETASLAYRRGNGKPSDVKPAQNNFAGLGATGKGEPGESFPDISTGVRAHLEHIVMYSGEKVPSPVAERTRKVQEWGVLTSWHKTFKRPITFSDIGKKWAPGDRNYADTLESVADKFDEEHCNKPDPSPQLVALARSGATRVAAADRPAAPAVAPVSPPPAEHDVLTGEQLAREAIERARREGDNTRSALGAGAIARATTKSVPLASAPEAETAKAEPAEKPAVTNAAAAASARRGSAPPAATAAATTVAALPKANAPAPAPAAGKCRVWTASYGGQRSVIISSLADGFTNYTVLDVNDGAEARETEAYIAAYAKDGQKIADFASQEQALDQAFKLCPEG